MFATNTSSTISLRGPVPCRIRLEEAEMVNSLPLPSDNAVPVNNHSPTDSTVLFSRGASYLSIQTIVQAAAQTISFAILARIITTAEMGMLAILSLVVSFSAALDGTAFSQAATKFVSECSPDESDLTSSIFYQNLRISVLISVPIAAIVFLEAPTLAARLTGSSTFSILFQVLAVDILLYAGALQVVLGALIGLRRFKTASMIGILGTILRQCLIVLLVILMKNLLGLVIAWVFSDLALLTLYLAYAVKLIGLPRGGFSARKLLSFSWPLIVASVITFAYSGFDRALLIVYVPLVSLGIYNVAVTAFTVLAYFSGTVGTTLLPAYSRIISRGNDTNKLEAYRNATALSSRYVSLIMIPLALGLMAMARPALALFVGQAYVGGVEPLMILCFMFALTVFSATLTPMLLALSQTRLTSVITVISVTVGLAAAYFLLPIWGVVGASLARGMTLVASCLLTFIALTRQKIIRLDSEAMWKSLTAGGAMAIVIFGVQLVAYNKLLLPAYAIAGLITYLMGLRLLKAVRKEDIELIGRYLGRLGWVSQLLSTIVLPRSHLSGESHAH